MKEKQEYAGVCAGCQKKIKYPNLTQLAAGYATLSNGGLLCYKCCGKRDSAWMVEHGHIVLYLTNNDSTLTNWPRTLEFMVAAYRNGRHNIAGTRTDVWFKGPDGQEWWGVQYGDRSQLCHCKRTGKKFS